MEPQAYIDEKMRGVVSIRDRATSKATSPLEFYLCRNHVRAAVPVSHSGRVETAFPALFFPFCRALVDVGRAVALHDLDGALRLRVRFGCNRNDDAVTTYVLDATLAFVQRGGARDGASLVSPQADVLALDAAYDQIVHDALGFVDVVYHGYNGLCHVALLAGLDQRLNVLARADHMHGDNLYAGFCSSLLKFPWRKVSMKQVQYQIQMLLLHTPFLPNT